MTERERLANLIYMIPYDYLDDKDSYNADFHWKGADFLLEKGVIFPRAKINQSIWTADPFTDGIPREGYITSIKIGYDHNAYYCSFGEIPLSFAFVDDDIGKIVFLTQEEAEKALTSKILQKE